MATKYHPGKTVQHLLHHNWHHMLSVWLTFWIFFICTLNPVLPEVIYRVDPLALLAATLRTYQRAGCDSEQLSLSCPRGTSISIELAQYGRAGDLTDHSLCPPISPEDLTTTGSSSSGGISSSNTDGSSVGIIGSSGSTDVIHSGTQIEVKPPELCTVSGLQYTLLQTVVDACQKKRHCKFSANSKPLASGDPCAGIRKFVEIAYKCRPYEFRSKVACENDKMPLECNPYSRIAIYSASFGYIERESVQCPHNNSQNAPDTNAKQTCLVSYATETVMQICHGRRRCSITADAGTFGRPCKNDIPMHLKVVYTCIPRKVLKDRYETAPEPDEPQQTELDLDQDELYDEDQFYKEGEAIPPAPKLQGAIPNSGFPYDFNMRSSEPTTTLMPSILSRNDNSLEENQEQFYLYLIISVAIGMLLCLTLVIGRLTLQRRRSCRKNSLSSCSNNEKNSSDKMGSTGGIGGGGGAGDNNKFQHEPTARETQLSGSFADDISDIDADIDLTSPMPVPSLSTRNETYMTYAPIPNCTYGSLGDHSSTNYGTATTMLMPSTSQHNSLMMPAGHNSNNSSGKPIGCPTVVGSRQTTPPPPGSLYTSMGVCSPSVSGTMTMGPHILTPSILSTGSNQNMGGPSYLSGTIMVPGHHHSHTGTLRRQLIPTSMGMMNTPQSSLVGGNTGPHSMVGVPTSSSVYYDSTIPRHLNRGVSADNTQYFYG
ncbi:protein eva-1-like isoform X2 [Lucilia sericata]|uniref:protein eva-1-like isoform X2 n=1 Tax=Lucilia sericata TaxID=13632 RepID=UPI0018A81F1C|nr:protein eva-1-like isoform X2 [Lucilia sericata]